MGNEERPAQLKDIIVENARKGAFDDSPLLSAVHFVACQNCRHRQRIVLLEHLKTGEFEIGKAEQMDVLTTIGIMDFVEKETFTPIIMRLTCDRCGFTFEVKLVNFEYLKTIIDRPKASRTMYA